MLKIPRWMIKPISNPFIIENHKHWSLLCIGMYEPTTEPNWFHANMQTCQKWPIFVPVLFESHTKQNRLNRQTVIDNDREWTTGWVFHSLIRLPYTLWLKKRNLIERNKPRSCLIDRNLCSSSNLIISWWRSFGFLGGISIKISFLYIFSLGICGFIWKNHFRHT